MTLGLFFMLKKAVNGGNMDARLQQYDDKMKKALEFLESDYGSIRAGRANPHVLDKIKVDYCEIADYDKDSDLYKAMSKGPLVTSPNSIPRTVSTTTGFPTSNFWFALIPKKYSLGVESNLIPT